MDYLQLKMVPPGKKYHQHEALKPWEVKATCDTEKADPVSDYFEYDMPGLLWRVLGL